MNRFRCDECGADHHRLVGYPIPGRETDPSRLCRSCYLIRLEAIAAKYNWTECKHDNNGVLVRRLHGSHDWHPVTPEQAADY